MSETTPKVTVVIPLYNTQRYIAETLQSIAAQSFSDYEVVVVNDASTDNGPAIVERAMRHDKRIRMVTQENRGLAGARNSGIRHARGTYIALLDADDLWHPEKLALHVAHLDSNLTIGVSFSPSRFIDDDGNDLGFGQRPRLTGIMLEEIFCRNPVGNGSTPMIRRSALDDIEFTMNAPEGARRCWFDESFRQSEDIECWSRMASLTGWRFEGLAPELTYYRVSTGGLSANVERQFETWCQMRDKIKSINPSLVARCGKRSEAYQHRYLARRLAVSGDGRKALASAVKSLRLYPWQLIEEPSRTIVTLGLAGVLALLPHDAAKAASRCLVSRRRGPPVPQTMVVQAR